MKAMFLMDTEGRRVSLSNQISLLADCLNISLEGLRLLQKCGPQFCAVWLFKLKDAVQVNRY